MTTKTALQARAFSDYAMLALGLLLVVIVVLNVADVATTALTLASGFFDSLTPADPTGSTR